MSLLIWVLLVSYASAQGIFESNVSGGTGNWNDSGSWTLLSGTDADGVPDSDDDVTILAGDEIDLSIATTNVDDLTITGTLDIAGNNRSINVGGNLVMSGTSAITGNNDTRSISVTGTFDVSSGASATINGEAVTVTGNTTIDGTLNFGNRRGIKTFSNVTISSTGNWNTAVRESFTITGNWVNNGSFTSCSNNACDYQFTSTSGTFSGSSDSNFSDIVIDGSASYTNNGSIIIADEIRGTGSFTNGNGSTLELRAAGPFGTSTFVLSTDANTVIYALGSNVSIVETTYHNLTINKSSGNTNNAAPITVNNDFTLTLGTFDVNATLNVGNDLLISGGRMDVNAATLSVTRDVSISGGELTPTDIGSVMNVTRDFLLSGTGIYDHNDGDLNITGDVNVTGGTMTMNESTVTATLDADNFTVATGSVSLGEGEVTLGGTNGIIVNSGTFRGNGAIITAANYDVNGGTNDIDGGSLIVSSINIENGDAATISNATVTVSGTTTINGTLNFDSGAAILTFNDIQVNSGGVWNVTATTDFTINGDITHNGTSWTGCNGNGCDYTLTSTTGSLNGSAALSFSDLIINGTASYTNNTTVSVTDRITGTGAFVNGMGSALSYSGNNSGGANFDVTSFTASAANNTVTYARAGDQQLRTTTDTDNNYYNVVISTTAAGQDVTLADNITIDNQLTLTMGDVILGANRLTIDDGTTISGGDADSYIQINSTGLLRQNYSASGTTLAFPIGDADDFSPITAFTLIDGTFSPGAFVEFDITDANHPNRNTDNTASGGDDDGTAAVAFISRYWTLTGSGITGERFDATYQYVDADVNGTESDMVGTLYRNLVSPAVDDWLARGIVTPGTNTVNLTDGDNFGDLYAMDNTLDRLPIVLISFEAEVVDDRVELSWVTTAEESNAFFTVERSSDGRVFEPVIFKGGAGDSDVTIRYTAMDTRPLEKRSFYRLKQTDFNGTFAYSEIISVLNITETEAFDFFIYGNPIQSRQNLKIRRNQKGEAKLSITRVNGQQVLEQRFKKSDHTDTLIPLPNTMQKGVYQIVIYQQGKRVSRKLIVN